MINKLKEILSDKSQSFWGRFFIRALSWITLSFFVFYRILTPLMIGEPIYLDRNDGYVMISAIVLILAIEAVKLATEAYLVRKSKDLK